MLRVGYGGQRICNDCTVIEPRVHWSAYGKMLAIYALLLLVDSVSDFWARMLFINMNILSIFLQIFTTLSQGTG
jgi:hypothetical protein